jgi:prepilin-type processing-associated H-X9-DG protein
MKQIGIAMHNYHTAINSFPMGGANTVGIDGTVSVWGSWSAHAMLLNYMEQTTIYSAINFRLACQGINQNEQAYNSTASSTIINVFLCPSATPMLGGSYGNFYGRGPNTSYFASVGSGLNQYFGGNSPAGVTVGNAPPNGIFMNGGPAYGIRDIPDGTSSTIAFGEWRIGDNNDTQLSVPQDIIKVGSTYPPGAGAGSALLLMPAGGAPLKQWLTNCAGSALATVSNGNQWSNLGQYWCEGLFGKGLGNTLVAPNGNYPNCAINTYGGDTDGSYGCFSLSSFHPGGGNVLFADGSVRFLKSSTNQVVIWQLGSRAQAEVISADAY